jgi:NADH:ubiquinone reductase (non-electrogenic)
MFSKQLITYTEQTFQQNEIDILTKTMVKEIKPKSVVVTDPNGVKKEIPFGLLVWAGVSRGYSILISSFAFGRY